jgi:methylated-DNA-[protein]-cysteine S-methyltransferase
MKKTFRTFFRSPIGMMEITGAEEGILSVRFVEEDEPAGSEEMIPECLKNCRGQLGEYFRGERNVFRLPLALAGTDFQKKVWNRVREIPYGETASYREIAAALGCPGAARAVGRANGSNPVCIIVPCHRVIGSDGALTGYAGGIRRKEWLLEHERRGKG